MISSPQSTAPISPKKTTILSQRHASKGWEDEAGLVDVRAVVSAELLLLLDCPAADWCLEIALGILAADHEADLAGWVGGDGGICVFDVGENLLAVFLELGDHCQVEPLVLSWEWILAYFPS